MERKQLEQEGLAVTDPATDAKNRRYFIDRANEEIERARRYRRARTLAILDIDDFKRINDTYGHEAGDGVLKTLVEIIRAGIRTTDLFARYGGEEFVVFLVESGIEEAQTILNRLRERVSNTRVATNGDAIGFTVSIGVTEYREKDTLDSLVARADDMLYRAKRGGKNRVCAEPC